MKTRINKAKGVTLIELVISIGLGVMIATASLQVFLIYKQTLMAQQALARIQENARIVGDVFGEDVSASGNLGCNAFREDVSFHVSPDIDADYFGLHSHQRIVGVSRHLNKKILQRLSSASDILWVKSVKKHYPTVKGTSGEQGYILFKGQPTLRGGEIVAISDCSHVDFVKSLTEVESQGQGISKLSFSDKILLSKFYPEGSSVGILNSTLFYIGNTSRVNSNGNPIHALYSTDINGRTLELIEGVDHLHVHYGEMNDDEVLFVEFDKVKNWKKVVKVRVKLLLNSVEDGLSKPKQYYINDAQVTPNDRLMRMWWSFEWPIKGLVSS